jgi:hypothetical protein
MIVMKVKRKRAMTVVPSCQVKVGIGGGVDSAIGLAEVSSVAAGALSFGAGEDPSADGLLSVAVRLVIVLSGECCVAGGAETTSIS